MTIAESSTKVVLGGARGRPDVATLRQDWWIQPVVTGASADVGRGTARAFVALLLSSIRAAVLSGEPRS